MKKYSDTAEQEAYQRQLKYFENIGWKRDVPEPYKAGEGDVTPE